MSAQPTLFGSNGTHSQALQVLALKKAIIKANIEYEIARALRIGDKAFRHRGSVVCACVRRLVTLRMCLRKRSAMLLRKSDLNPHAPVWIPQRLRRPRMGRYHAVMFAGAPNVLCAQQ